MKLKALKDLLVNKFYSKYIPSLLLSDTQVQNLINAELAILFAENNVDEKALEKVD